MQLNEAVRIVQQKFNAESEGKMDGPELEAYQDAFKRFPVVMEVATHCVADQIIQANYEARRQAAMARMKQQQQGGAAAPAAPGGANMGGFSLPGMAAPVGTPQPGAGAAPETNA